MKSKNAIAAAVSFAVLSMTNTTSVLAAETLVCVPEKSVGFRWEGKAWGMANFRVGDEKLLVKPVTEYEYIPGMRVNYEITKFGSDAVNFRCYRAEGTDQTVCGGLGWGIVVNFRSLRYQELYGIGYVDGRNSEENTPSLTIGTCAKL